ncbi:MAG TPA: hypothetical protein VME63_12120 [Dyella sp.]|uniref:hypothetical protein n=1 Tax=Dyella sp. TaxID=1869338 RepID=UPI002B702F95|nr:hypothetical protein [Dyella sp.]HTV86150.1 hypothetical protein [Dyella sp.]
MKAHIVMLALLACKATLACAKQPSTKGIQGHEWNFDGCHFKMADPFRGRTSGPGGAAYFAQISPKARHPFETWIQFSCQNPVTPEIYVDRAGIRMTDKGWALDPSPDNIGLKEQHTTFYALHGKGWDGGGVTQDDINGDEKRRTRAFSFCIPHKQLALCGSIQNVAYLMWLKETTLPQVIKLLESIEFVDTPASGGTAAKP